MDPVAFIKTQSFHLTYFINSTVVSLQLLSEPEVQGDTAPVGEKRAGAPVKPKRKTIKIDQTFYIWRERSLRENVFIFEEPVMNGMCGQHIFRRECY